MFCKKNSLTHRCIITVDEKENSKECEYNKKTKRCKNIKKEIIKKKAAGIVAETDFVNILKTFIGNQLNHHSKDFLNKISRPMNQIDYNDKVILKKVEQTGKDNKNGKKADCKLQFEIEKSTKKKRYLEIGISYKRDENRTIQSWSTNYFWKGLFGEKVLNNILNKILEIINLRASIDKDNEKDLFTGVTIHLKTIGKKDKKKNQHLHHYYTLNLDPTKNYTSKQVFRKYKQILLKNHPDKTKTNNYNIQKIMNSYHYLKENLKPVKSSSSTKKNSNKMKDIENKLNFELNNLFQEKEILKIALGTDCQLYYHNDELKCKNINEFLESKDLYNNIRDNNNYIVKKLRDKFAIDIRYIRINSTSSNQSAQNLIIWVPNKNIKNICIKTTKDCLQYGQYLKYNDLPDYIENNLGNKKINSGNLIKYYKSKYNITFPLMKI